MHQPIFILKDPLLPGSYLAGDYAWTEEVRLDRAVLIGRAPLVGPVVLTLG
jgi:hypothetical protein